MRDFNKALNYSFLLLKYRARTKKEIINRLRIKKFPLSVIEKVIKSLADYGYVNDHSFTSAFIKEKIDKGFSKKRIYFDLKRLGIDDNTIKAGLDSIDRNHYIEEMRRVIKKKLKCYSSLESRRDKLSHYLTRRGFTLDEIKEALDEDR